MPRPILLVAAALAVIGLAAAAGSRLLAPPPVPIELEPATAAPTAAPSPLLVDVAGAVARPGVVRLPPGARVLDALAAAGGALPEADLVGVNRAGFLRDGDRLYVPRAGEVVPARAAGADPRVDLNRAAAAELEALPGIGPGIAGRIIRAREQRPFARADELQTRGLVSARVFAELRELVVVR